MLLGLLLGCDLDDGLCASERYEPAGIVNTASECAGQGLCALRCTEGICGPEAARTDGAYWCEDCERVAGLIGFGEGFYRVTLEAGGGLFVGCEEGPEDIDPFECPVERYQPTGTARESTVACSALGLCALTCTEEVCGEWANDGTGATPWCEPCDALNAYTGFGAGRFWMEPVPGGVELACFGPSL